MAESIGRGPVAARLTAGVVAQLLGLGRDQVLKLGAVGLLRQRGWYRNGPEFDPGDVADLQTWRWLPLIQVPAQDRPAALTPGAAVVHLAPLARDEQPKINGRKDVGYDHRAPGPRSRWDRWWPVGHQRAAAWAGWQLPLLADVSTFVVHVGRIRDWFPHPVYPGVAGFTVVDDAELTRTYTRVRCSATQGPGWTELFDPAAIR